MNSPSVDRYQLLPPLSAEEFASLKADIAVNGVLVPVVIDADSGETIEGHHRVRAWTELRTEKVAVPDYPREVRRFDDDEARTAFILAANLFRRHLTRAQRAEVVATLRERGWSLRRVSGAIGVHHETVRRDLEGVADATGASNDTPTIIGRDQKTYPARRNRPAPSIIVKSSRDEARARAALSSLGDEAPSGLLALTRAEERARIASLARRRAEEIPVRTDGQGWEHRTGDLRKVFSDLPDNSVDAIVCDPPYALESVPLYSDLAVLASRLLKPGRLCIAYCGKVALPEYFERLGEHLEYVWTGAVFLPGRHNLFHRKKIFGRWRPVALFSSGPYVPRTTIVDALWAEGTGEKSLSDHPWQQAVVPFAQLVQMAALPGELVVDPFLGSGTTALACLSTGRRFLGCDLDPGAVSLALERISSFESGDIAFERPTVDEAECEQ
jgi:ParB-like chromosome segregation protein Spo0J